MRSFFFIILLILCQRAFGQYSNVPYVPLYTDATFTRNISTALAVGAVAGQAEVSLTGGATYAIPIQTPPGTNNMVPTLTVAYNSLGSDGHLGMGWGLSGLSVITRTNKDFFHDNVVGPANLVNTDQFDLDGNRLVAVSGSYGANGTTYYTKGETFSRITSNGDLGGGPQWFKVEMKSGVTYEYGNSVDSRFLKEDNSVALFWRLNKIYDNFGNYVEFKYKKDQRDSRIDEIWYTGNSNIGLVPYNKIKFVYEYRTDKKSNYNVGSEISNNFLLTRIQVRAENDQAFKEYELLYSFDNIHSYLKEIIEWGDDGTRFNATLFKYGNAVENIKYQFETNTTLGEDGDLFPGDFNGDGVTDLIVAPYQYIGGFKYHTSFQIHIKDRTTNTTTQVYSSGTLPIEYEIIDNKLTPSTFAFMADDYNGDGRDDIMLTRKVVSGGYTRLNLIRIYYSANDSGSAYTMVEYNTNSAYDIISETGHYIQLGDLDGDGRAEVLTMRSNGTGYKAFVLQPDISSSIAYDVWIHVSGSNYQTNATSWVDADQLFVIDFDGDGKNEVMVIGGGTCVIHTFKTFLPSVNLVQTELLGTVNAPSGNDYIYLGDFNGDHKTDLLARTLGGSQTWKKYISTGKNYNATIFNFNIAVDLPSDKIKISDYDGDGKADIVHSHKSNPAFLDVYYSQGNTFYYQHNAIPVYSSTADFVSGDFNGDGRRDFVRCELRPDLTTFHRFFYFMPNGENHLLQKIANGFNHLITIDYDLLTAGGSFYNKGGTTAYPLNNIQSPIYAVASMSMSNGLGGTNTTNYTYEQAKLHRRGRGWLGFKKVYSSNATMNRKSVTEFEINTTYFVNMMKTVSEFRVDNSASIAYSDITNSIVPMSNGRYWQRVDQSLHVDNVRKFQKSTANTYDNFGNVTTSVETRKPILSVVNQEVTTTTNQFGTFGSWLASSPTQTTVSNVRGTQAAYSTTTKRTFNTQGAVTQEISFWGLPKAVTTNYTYNTFGKVSTAAILATGLATRTTAYGYDPKGRFVISTTNPLSQVATATFSAKWGKPLTATSISGLTTTYEYDGYGRLKKSTSPEGNIVQTDWGWDAGSISGVGIGATTIVYYTNTQVAGRPNQKEWLDVLGRSRRTEKEGLNFQWIAEQTTYDLRGNVSTTTAPYYIGGSGVVTTMAYDALNRLTSATNSIGTTTYSFAYPTTGFRTLVIRPDGMITSQTMDASDRIVESTDHGGTPVYDTNIMTFEYNSQGNQTRVLLGANQLSAMAYDEYGRQKELNEKNSGITQYVYNAFDELASETDANGNNHQVSYDVLGRMTQRVGPEGTTSYEYVTLNNGLNLIKKVTGFNGITQEFTYDAFSRMTEEKETIDGAAYITSYTLNSFGDVVGVNYPSGFGLTRQYDVNGYLLSVKNIAGTVTMYSVGSLNAYGQNTSYTLGNGVTTQVTYDAYGFPTRYLAGTKQDLNMVFNVQTGNLTSRTDAIKGKTETFTYDNSDRLLTAQVTGQAAVVLTYGTNGNILTKTGIGNYTYAANKINAAIGLTNPGGIVPAAFQSVTYSAFHQPNNINEGIYDLTFTYGPDYERRKTVMKQNNVVTETRYFLGSYEKRVAGATTQHIHYVSGENGLNAIVVRENGVDTYYYTYTDHIGSILTVTNTAGAIVAEQNFDPWGRARNATTWLYTGLPVQPTWLFRGYTGHEHLPQFNLINMNGRLYDPLMGRMLSADEVVADQFSSQAYNKYTYANNNPLKYTDANGEFFMAAVLIGALIGGALNLTVQAAKGNVHSGKQALAAFGMGALGGALIGLGVGAATSALAITQTVANLGLSTLSSFLPSINVPVGDHLTLSLSPALFLGGNGFGVGANVGVSVQTPYLTLGASYGATYYGNHPATHTSFVEQRIGYGATIGGRNFHASFGSTTFKGGGVSQMTGFLGFGGKNWGFTYENDYMKVPLAILEGTADGGDRFRTTGLRFQAGDFSVGLNMFTGDPGLKDREKCKIGGDGPKGTYYENSPEYRMGALYIGYGNYRAGVNSENVRAGVQHWVHKQTGDPQFYKTNSNWSVYSGIMTKNPFTTW